MGNRLVAWLAGCAVSLGGIAAQPGGESAPMGKLAHLVGEWRGSGWIAGPGGKRGSFESEERVEARLGGEALVIEGVHRAAGSGAVVHHAVGLLSWDAKRAEYRFATALPGGRGGVFPGRVEEGRFTWTAPGARERRFVISLEDPDRWVEHGEITLDGGKSWQRFFEMSLTRRR